MSQTSQATESSGQGEPLPSEAQLSESLVWVHLAFHGPNYSQATPGIPDSSSVVILPDM